MQQADSPATSKDHAIVIGASMAGLLAGRVLSDHFTKVTIVDRDRFPSTPTFRKGAPQAHHVHVLLSRGLEILKLLFPDISEELLTAGAIPLRWPRDTLWLGPRGWVPRFEEGIDSISCGRELVEWTVRKRLAAYSTVTITESTDVTGLLVGGDKRRVTGVLVRDRTPELNGKSPSRELHADLVIDASGRNSKTSDWLTQLGYAAPRAERIDGKFGYASRDYEIPAGFTGSWKGIYLQTHPPQNARGGALFQIAPDRWRVGLLGAGSDHPPTDEAGYMEFARSLRSPIIYNAISQAMPLTAIRGYQQTANSRRYFEQMHDMPGRLLVTGDAGTTFNPIYGQGMTAAAQSAFVLDQVLAALNDADLDTLGPIFHKRAAKANAGAWLIATGEDLRYATTVGGRRGIQTYATHRYLDRVFRGILEDSAALSDFLDVIQLVAPPSALFKPSILVPALRYGGRPDRDAPEEPLGMPTRTVTLPVTLIREGEDDPSDLDRATDNIASP